VSIKSTQLALRS